MRRWGCRWVPLSTFISHGFLVAQGALEKGHVVIHRGTGLVAQPSILHCRFQIWMGRSIGGLANNFVLRSSGVFRRQRFHRTDRKATTWSWWVNRLMTKWWLIGVNWVYSLKLWNFQVSNATCSQIANRMCKIQPMIVRSVRRQMSKMLADF